MKTGKEIKTNNFKNYTVTFGCVNDKNPKAIYINISTWALPKDEEITNYSSQIRGLNKKIKQTIFNEFSENNNELFDKNRTIIDLDIRESGIRFGKRSFLSCEITLYQSGSYSITSDTIKDELNRMTNIIIKNNFENNKTFEFYKKKI